MLEIRLMGQFDVRRDSQPVEIPSRPAQSLLAYLALNAGIPQRREKLAGMLWPDSDEESARTNLRGALWRAKEAIGEEYFEADRLNISFRSEADYWLDAKAIRQPVHENTSLEELAAEAGAYAGELLPGFYDEWVLPEREHIQAAFERKMQLLMQGLVAAARWIEVLEWAEHWIAQGQAPEPAYRALMTAHAALGDHSSMTAAYRRLRSALEADLGVEPSPETQALYEELASGQATIPTPVETKAALKTAPQAAPRAAPRHNLPTQATPFIGRTAELDDLAALIAEPTCRLITIVAPGGMGKTRLAVEAAGRQIGSYKDGVYFVSLASIDNPEFMISEVADAIGIVLSEGRDPRSQLLRCLRDKQMLLVLDNFEDVLDEARFAADLVAAAGGVTLLVTSQQRLNLQSECLYELAGLHSPVSAADDDVEQSEAVQMFVVYAQRLAPHFALNDENKAAIAQVCQLVGGMPLGIELAAAWLPMLSPQEIAEEIQQTLDLLETSALDIPSRHRSMRVVIERTWSMLSEAEQATLMKLSVFRGGFTREAVRSITDASPASLMSLFIGKSLIQRETNGRYRIQELVRRYALEQLAGDWALYSHAQERAWTYYEQLLFECAGRLKGPGIQESLDGIHAEIDNIRAAWVWAVENMDYGRLAGPLLCLWMYYSTRGTVTEGRSLFELSAEVLIRRGIPAGDPLHWQMRAAAMDLTFDARLQQQVLSLLAELDAGIDPRSVAPFGTILAGNALQFLPEADARALIDRTVQEAMQSGDVWEQGAALFGAGYSLLNLLNSRAEGRQRLADAIRLLRPTGDHFWLSRALVTLADSEYQAGNYERAKLLLTEARTLVQRIRDRATESWTAILLGRTAAAQGSYREAQRWYEENLSDFRELAFPYMRSMARFAAGHFAMLTGDYAEARRQIDESFSMTPHETEPDRRLQYLIYQGSLALALKNDAEALMLLEQALAQAEELKHHVGMATILSLLGSAAHRNGELDRAVACYREAMQRALEIGLLPEVLRSLIGLAVLLQDHQPDQAAELAALVKAHPATHDREKQRAITLLSALEDALPQEVYQAACERGASRPLDEMIGEVMASPL